MVTKSKVYTKTGDKGETSLVGGTRLSKGDDQIELYGEVDELNSFLGYSKELLGNEYKKDRELIEKIQSSLFDLGSHLACETDKRETFKLPLIDTSIVLEIESRIDECDSACPPLKNFILPGGDSAAANLHITRSVSRRVERHMIKSKVLLPENALTLMNRMSDYFFVLSRYVNISKGVTEVLWKPKAN
jgi:cob(I)alamin adenosyltransferase